MDATERNHAAIVKKINELTPEMIQEVIDFIDFLKTKKNEKKVNTEDILFVQQKSLSRIWESEFEDLYEI